MHPEKRIPEHNHPVLNEQHRRLQERVWHNITERYGDKVDLKSVNRMILGHFIAQEYPDVDVFDDRVEVEIGDHFMESFFAEELEPYTEQDNVALDRERATRRREFLEQQETEIQSLISRYGFLPVCRAFVEIGRHKMRLVKHDIAGNIGMLGSTIDNIQTGEFNEAEEQQQMLERVRFIKEDCRITAAEIDHYFTEQLHVIQESELHQLTQYYPLEQIIQIVEEYAKQHSSHIESKGTDMAVHEHALNTLQTYVTVMHEMWDELPEHLREENQRRIIQAAARVAKYYQVRYADVVNQLQQTQPAQRAA